MNIRKDERGVCKTTSTQKYIDGETGEEKMDFMNVLVSFKKGVEVKNKARIKVLNGFLTHIRIETNEIDENGKPIIIRMPKIMIMDFELLEEGIDENARVPQYNTPETQEANGFEVFGTYDGELPF